MRTSTTRAAAAFLVAALAVGVSMSPASALTSSGVSSGAGAMVQAELTGWQKTLLSKKQTVSLSGIRSNIDLVKNYVDESTIAKTWAGERDGTGMTSVIVQVGKMPSKGWKASMKGYAKNGGYTVDQLTSGTFKAQREGASGTQGYVVMKNAGPYYVLIEMTVPGGSADAAKFYGIAESMADVQKKQLNAAGYGK